MSWYSADVVDEQLKALCKKFETTELGMGVLYGIYISLNIHYKLPTSLIDFETRIPDLIKFYSR